MTKKETKKWKKHVSFAIKSLHLDTKNPRTDIGRKITEKGLIKELLKEDVLGLSKDIAENGFLAASTIMVVEEGSKQITVDGNRRLLAVQILQNLEIVNGLVSEKAYTNLLNLSQNASEDITELFGVLYPSRKDAEKEMATMHLSGIAVKQWKLIRQCRYFQKRLDEEKDLSIETLAELLGIDKSRLKRSIKTYQLYKIAKSKLPDLKNTEGDSIYDDDIFLTDKFQRLIVHEEGERFLGYTFSDDKQIIQVGNEKKFLERLKFTLQKMYDDSLPAQFKSSDRLNVFREKEPQFLSTKEYKRQLKAQQEKVKTGQNSMFSFAEDSTYSESEPGQRSAEKSDPLPRGLFSPSKVPYKLGNKQLQKLYNELKDPVILKFPNAAHDLFRSFLECSLVTYLKHQNIKKYQCVLEKKKKNQKNLTLTDMLSYLGKDTNSPIKDKNIRDIAWQLVSDDRAVYSVERMNLVNHNENWFSEESDVRKTWDKAEPLLKIILNPKKDEK